MITSRTPGRDGHPARRRIAALFSAIGLLATAALAATATSASASAPPGCGLRSCIVDVATGALNDPTMNREAGPNNCNFFSGYWGTSGDDICGTSTNGHKYRSNEWCADFARYVWANAGANVSGLDPFAGSFYRANSSNGFYHPKGSGYVPAAGDAVIFDWDGTPSLGNNGWDIDHVGIVIQYSNGTLYDIEGNTNQPGVTGRDGVFQRTRTTSSVVGYVTPRSA
jgi:CHAP domain